MQVGSEQLARQQEIMQSLGYYNGKIDGIWGPKTIEAKIKWEMSGKFNPALPNNGLPFGDKGPFPRGVYREPKTGLLSCPQYELVVQERAKKNAAPEQPKEQPAKQDQQHSK